MMIYYVKGVLWGSATELSQTVLLTDDDNAAIIFRNEEEAVEAAKNWLPDSREAGKPYYVWVVGVNMNVSVVASVASFRV